MSANYNLVVARLRYSENRRILWNMGIEVESSTLEAVAATADILEILEL